MLEDDTSLQAAIDTARPEAIVHLPAQAGVRYSIDNPRAYIDANIIGSSNVTEGARRLSVRHLLMASTSTVHGANTEMPFTETQKCDMQMSFYAATKKATEAMAHSHAHLFGIPTTRFRFFTFYGLWGRPDMALFKFTKAILADQPIDIYNHGDMWRDFTYVDDLVRAIALLINCPLSPPGVTRSFPQGEGRSEGSTPDSSLLASPPSPPGASSTSAIPIRSACSTSSMPSKNVSAVRLPATTWTCSPATFPPSGPTPAC